MRCASPPERVADGRSRLRYSRPTSRRKVRRAWISLRTWWAIWASRPVSTRLFRNSAQSRMGRAATSAMDLPLINTDRDAGLRRAPLQAGQGTCRMYSSYRSRAQSESVSPCLRWTYWMAPSNPVLYLRSRPKRLRYCTTTLWSLPCRMVWRTSLPSFSHGVAMEKPTSLARPSRSRFQYSVVAVPSDHGAMAPSDRDSSGLGTMSSSSTSSRVPIPLQAAQAPNGLLNENERGSISSMASGCSLGHARFSEKARIRPGSSASRSTNSARTRPSASPRAVSMESVSRWLMPSLTTRRSTTTSMVCLNCLPSLGGSLSWTRSPSTRALVEFKELVHNLLRGLLGHRLAAHRAMRPADTGPQQAHVVVDFGDGAH